MTKYSKMNMGIRLSLLVYAIEHRYDLAEKWYNECLSRMRAILESEHPSILKVANNFASLTMIKGNMIWLNHFAKNVS